ncbi:MAG TPA: alkaline phosphatase D family protein [Kofleriaceae bacterium]|nr:alkaline phosphatase D family protein [Kofleriaceae bacterium]
MTLTRREWLRATGAGAAAMVLPHVGCGGGEAEATALVLEVDDRRALVSVWSAAGGSAEVTVETVTGAVHARERATLGPGGAGVARFDRLAPATAYRARVRTEDGVDLPPYRFVTAPAADDPRPVRLAIGADIDPDPAYDSPMFDTLAAAAADVYVSLGDWPYADNPPFTRTADNCRFRHVEARAAAKLQPWLTTTSVRAIYDDHEVRNDWDTATWAADPELHDTALAVWDEFFPRHEPAEAPRYRRWRWGAHVECFLLDTRRYRSSSKAPDGPTKTMLGADQRAWLLDGVTTSTAPFKLVLTSVPLDFGHGVDHWAGYRTERDAILDALADAGTPGVLFVSGDQHWYGAYRHRHGARELQIGPLARAPFEPPPPLPGVLATSPEYNVGVVDVDATGLRLRALAADGRALHDETVTPDDLRLRRA